jgi:hypothetical protein
MKRASPLLTSRRVSVSVTLNSEQKSREEEEEEEETKMNHIMHGIW